MHLVTIQHPYERSRLVLSKLKALTCPSTCCVDAQRTGQLLYLADWGLAGIAVSVALPHPSTAASGQAALINVARQSSPAESG